jgi:hypothetical protein
VKAQSLTGGADNLLGQLQFWLVVPCSSYHIWHCCGGGSSEGGSPGALFTRRRACPPSPP